MAPFCKFVDQGSNLCGNRGFPSHTKNTDRASSGNNSPCRGSELGFRPREVSGEALGEVSGEASGEVSAEALGEELDCLLHHRRRLRRRHTIRKLLGILLLPCFLSTYP